MVGGLGGDGSHHTYRPLSEPNRHVFSGSCTLLSSGPGSDREAEGSDPPLEEHEGLEIVFVYDSS